MFYLKKRVSKKSTLAMAVAMGLSAGMYTVPMASATVTVTKNPNYSGSKENPWADAKPDWHKDTIVVTNTKEGENISTGDDGSLAIGKWSSATDEEIVNPYMSDGGTDIQIAAAIGRNAHAKNYSTAVGSQYAYAESDSTTFGGYAKSAGESTAVGNWTDAGNKSVAIGFSASAGHDCQDIPIGYHYPEQHTGMYSYDANSEYGVAVGYDSSTTGSAGTAIGAKSAAKADGATAIGGFSSADKERAVAVGNRATITTKKAIAIGYAAYAGSQDSDKRAYLSDSVKKDETEPKYDKNLPQEDKDLPVEDNTSIVPAPALPAEPEKHLAEDSATTSSDEIYNENIGKTVSAELTDAGPNSAVGVDEGNEGHAVGGSAPTATTGTAATKNLDNIGAGNIAIGDKASAVSQTENDKANVAIGQQAQAVGSNSVAIGTDSYANEANTVSVGSSGADGTVKQTRRIVNVAEGTADNDAVTVSQLNKAKADVTAKASTDATNKANAAKTAAINTAATDATNKMNQAITAAAKDATTKANAAQANAIAAAAKDAQAKADAAKTQAIATAATDATNKANVAKTAAINAAATDATNKANVAKTAAISAAATDATNKANAAEKNAKSYADTTVANAKTALQANIDKKANADLGNISEAGKNVIRTIVGKGSASKVGTTDKNLIVKSTTANDTTTYQIGLNRNLDADSYAVGGKTYVSNTGLNANGQKIANVAAGTKATDAVNVGQLRSAQHKLSSDISSVGAQAAAMANLHPMDNGGKASVAASLGSYDDEQAVALGAFYRPDKSSMLSVSGVVSESKNMVGVGFSKAIGKVAEPETKESDVSALKDTVNEQASEIKTLKSQVKMLMQKLADKL